MNSDFDLDRYNRVNGLMMRVELVLIAVSDGQLQLLMAEREREPCAGSLVLPGGYMHEDQSLVMTADLLTRRLGFPPLGLKDVGVFSEPSRDPRARVVSAAYCSAVEPASLKACASRHDGFRLVDATVSNSSPVTLSHRGEVIVPGLDHNRIVMGALSYLRAMLDNSVVAFRFLPLSFTLLELQTVHQLIRGEQLEKVLFRKRMLARIFTDGSRLVPTGEYRQGAGRPAKLYERSCGGVT
ncbi:MAG: NUDIX hydrolase [Novosphingobium sp.]|nr:NUDIX hydrolase [Novosphingobium sp.]